MHHLRCTRCVRFGDRLILVKQWDAHLLTKQHRQSVARVKKEEEKDAKKRDRAVPAEEEDEGKRKRAKVEVAEKSNLPAGFFSSGGPSVVEDGPEQPTPTAQPGPAAENGDTGEAKDVDEDLDAFLSSLAEPEEATAAPAAPAPTAPAPAVVKKRSKYRDIPEGVASYSAAPVLINGAEQAEEETEPEETPAERRARLAREEKEEILQRLDDEQRAQ